MVMPWCRKRDMKRIRRHSLVLLLVAFCAAIAFLWWQQSAPPQVAERQRLVPVPPTEPAAEAGLQPPLNIQLPQEHLLVDPALAIPEQPSPLKPLFKMEEKPSTVAVGGGLILEEERKDPEAPIWDQVKGAKVEVEVKID